MQSLISFDTNPISVRKRDGKTVQPFNLGKIESAVKKAWLATNNIIDDVIIAKVIAFVSDSIKSIVDIADVEQIQDAVEVGLMRAKQYTVAKEYILYRQKRSEKRVESLTPDPTAISDYVQAAKYARYLPDLQRREVYEETVYRVEDMHMRRFGHIPEIRDEIKKAFKLVREKRVLPSMRSMQFGGKAVEVNNARLFNCSATLVDRPKVFSQVMFMLLCGAGVGYSVQFEHIEKLPTIAYVDVKKVVHHIIADDIEGWSDAVDALINSYLDGTNIEFSYHLIRSAGTPLKISGGRAPGHMKLKDSLEKVRAILHSAQGRKLRSVDCHRMLCLIAEAVLSGGIRRSAMISLFSLEDSEMMNLKTDKDWFDKEPTLANANNSVVVKKDEAKKKQFKRIFEMTKSFGEPGVLFVNDYNHITNPCQPSWATLLTPNGISTMGEIKIGDTIWSGKQWTKVINKEMTGIKPVLAYHTTAGTFYGTSNHRILENGIKIEVSEARSIDTAQGAETESTKVQNLTAIVDGLVLGDGMYHGASRRVFLCAGPEEINEYRRDLGTLVGIFRPGVSSSTYEVTTSFDTLPHTYNRTIPHNYFHTIDLGFLRGLYSANGSVVAKRITLKATSFKVIEAVQQMLSAIGIISYYTTNKATEIVHHNGVYTSRKSYDLNIGSLRGRQLFAEKIGFIQSHKTAKLAASLDGAATRAIKNTFDINKIKDLGEEEVYDITVDAPEHTYWTGGLLVSNCGEIGLYPLWQKPDGTTETGFAMCNLTEINGAMLTSADDFEEAARAATLIGTLQAAYTSFPYLGQATEEIVKRDALLGVGITGMQDSPAITLDPELQRRIATKVVEWNAYWAQMIGINPAARTTCIKPSGTTSLLFGSVGSGIHAHHSSKYIRRVTADEYEAIFQVFKAKNPLMCIRKPNGKWVIEFPVEAPKGATLKEDLTAVKFMDMVRSTQQNWVEPGTGKLCSSDPTFLQRHNVSNTIEVKADEWETVAEYLWKYRNDFAGVSLLPDTGDQIYAFAPFEAVKTAAQLHRWNELIAHYTPVDYMNTFEAEDGTNLTGEAACAGGACALV